MSVVVKNGHVIDCPELAKTHHVYQDASRVPYTCMLNQTDVRSNKNKYYRMQLLVGDANESDMRLYIRYGRIGEKGRASTKRASVSDFNRQFRNKTGNHWNTPFTAKSGKYFLTKLAELDKEDDSDDDTAGNAAAPETAAPTKPAPVTSSLPKRVRLFVELIGNVRMFSATLKSFNIDVKKMPLGKISKDQIASAWEVLKRIDANLGTYHVDEVEMATSEFYTLIPTSFGRRRPPLIDNKETVQHYSDMLSVLADIEIAGKILQRKTEAGADGLHPCDRVYRDLGVGFEPLSMDPSSPEYQALAQYVESTHGETHRYHLEIQDIIKVDRPEEAAQFRDFGNNVLLFHGSRLANFMGIFSTGLRINSGAVTTGKMFGNGLYFANCVSKSANYCFVSSNGTGIILVCRVSLGNSKPFYNSHYEREVPNDVHQSTHGIGAGRPDPANILDLDGMRVPVGPLVRNPDPKVNLRYDEFIVYDPRQVQIRYAIKLKFKHL